MKKTIPTPPQQTGSGYDTGICRHEVSQRTEDRCSGEGSHRSVRQDEHLIFEC